MFSEHREAVRRLKQTNAYFKRWCDEHNALDAHIKLLEMGGLTSHEELVVLKHKRLVIKDALYAMLLDDQRSRQGSAK
ncbi:YdcH family protein [Vibrio parahaemolyticus]|uniref:YdcH family protein n=1 Tax=Vibrio parahaemolyticus TaxID=670 RepID=UPI0038923D72